MKNFICLIALLFSSHAVGALAWAVEPDETYRYFLYKGEGYDNEGLIRGEAVDSVHVLLGESRLMKFKTEIVRTSIADPAIADIVVVSPEQILVNAKAYGSTTLVVWDKEQKSRIYDVTVGLDVPRLQEVLKALAPDEEIKATPRNETIVLQGEVKRQQTIDDIDNVVKTFTEKVVNLVRLKEARQILLKVKFAEVNRSATQQLGMDFVAGDNKYFKFFSMPNSLISNVEKDGSLTFSQATKNIFQFGGVERFAINAFFDNLEKKGLLKILAEPNLVTLDGKEASFLAGGEFPIPISLDNKIHIEFKEYGVKLKFTPIITEKGIIRLKVNPETSVLDLVEGAVKINGFTIPGLITRKAETNVELKDGESLVIGGLISNKVSRVNRRVPGLAQIPVLGVLFQSKNFENNETELLVLVTPVVVQPIQLPDKKEIFSPERIQDLFKKENPRFKEKQGDNMKQYLDHLSSQNSQLEHEVAQLRDEISDLKESPVSPSRRVIYKPIGKSIAAAPVKESVPEIPVEEPKKWGYYLESRY